MLGLLGGTVETGVSQEEAGEAGDVGVVTRGGSAAQVGVTGGLMNTESLHLSWFDFRRSVKDGSSDGAWNERVRI